MNVEDLTPEEIEQLRQAKILASQNDQFRRTVVFGNPAFPGRCVVTAALRDHSEGFAARALLAVRSQEHFPEGDDPYGEHDFGCVTVDGQKVLWKIDYYDNELQFHSPDRLDPQQTCRVLTVMLPLDW